jgi:glycerol dehydrogenase
MLGIFCAPSRYVQGRDATAALGEQLSHLQISGPVLLLASRRTADQLSNLWEQALSDFTYVTHIFGGECTQAEINAGVTAGQVAGATAVIGAGGGKALDASRAVAAQLQVPAINCPTLASSDAPCSALSVVYNEDGSVDRYQFYPTNPVLVLVDTTLVAQAPRRYLVSGMGDALATWYEARTVIEAHGVNQVGGAPTLTAGALAKLCRDTLFADGLDAARSVDACSVTPALERVVEANTLLSGLGFESGGLAIAHSVHNGLTVLPPTHAYLHGEKVAFGLLVQLVVEGRDSSEISEVINFCRSVGLPTRLSDLGLADLDKASITAIAERTVQLGETAHHEPFEVTTTMIADGIRAADEWARAVAVRN